MAKLISQSYGELQPAVCSPRGYAAIWRWPVHSWTSEKPQKQLLVNVYSYCLMMKSVSCCCVRGSQLFSNLVTHTHTHTHIYMWPGLAKQVLSTQNILVGIMAPISCSVCAIQNLLVLLDFPWISALCNDILDKLQVTDKSYYILNSQNHVKL